MNDDESVNRVLAKRVWRHRLSHLTQRFDLVCLEVVDWRAYHRSESTTQFDSSMLLLGRELQVIADEQEKLLSNRRRLAAELRRLRDRAGLSGRQLAEQIRISQSKVSRIESGLTVPSAPEVAAWAAAVSASGTATELLTALTDVVYTEVHPWHAALREKIHLQDEIQEIENRARTKLTYEPSLVPGLLQTAEYAR